MSALLTKEQLENFALQGLSYADDHVSDPFSIKDVSERLGISYSYFYHNFAFHMGEPFWHYVKRHRLELAAGLLRHSGYNIGEIGEHCGYATTAAFSKAFKQHFKESPKDFRRILILPNEKRTLQITETITAAIGSEAFHGLFNYDRCEKIKLPDSILYYSFISRGQNPVAEMIARMNFYQGLFKKMQTLYDVPQSRIITGTLDAVPVTDYEKLSMFAGLLVPTTAIAAHIQLQHNHGYLMTKRISGGYYLKLPVPMDFATAGIPMYNFISMNCKEGIFKMSGNHFFISLDTSKYSEIYIPLLKKHY
ncbi:helix-turn-helix transcriptional regulator [Chitinophaga arvensicola]|uniref:AraC-type DNA-binding protein n=1 Tax=Chitinophaga arvensicola TaxID=29529 RepID=A0A1I0SDQ8_9BACT|nr:AraC family transcriptional regulator [Chitinophaga arvensicola]SEW57268.1 AraC-type DNA-binding protein [Chitinophaga arvensicola]